MRDNPEQGKFIDFTCMQYGARSGNCVRESYAAGVFRIIHESRTRTRLPNFYALTYSVRFEI